MVELVIDEKISCFISFVFLNKLNNKNPTLYLKNLSLELLTNLNLDDENIGIFMARGAIIGGTWMCLSNICQRSWFPVSDIITDFKIPLTGKKIILLIDRPSGGNTLKSKTETWMFSNMDMKALDVTLGKIKIKKWDMVSY